MILIIFTTILTIETATGHGSLENFLNKGQEVSSKCGCNPDAMIRTVYDTKVMVFSGPHWYPLYDPFEDGESIEDTKQDILEDFLGLEFNVEGAFDALQKYFFVKSGYFWVFDQDKQLINFDSTEKWTNFPPKVDAIQIISDMNLNTTALMEVFVADKVIKCKIYDEMNITCAELNDPQGVRGLDGLEQLVGVPITATTLLAGGIRIISGEELMCISFPPNTECHMLCHPHAFQCHSSLNSKLVLVAIIITMICLVILVGMIFWANTIDMTGSAKRRGF